MPPEPLGRLFLRYLRFGFLAWGGPVAQISMIRQELVHDKGWVSNDRFNRTLAVYQVLPGPEAHELCVHYGMSSRGRVGALLAGLGFMLPGVSLMMLFAWLYVSFGLGSPWLVAAFAALHPAVLALIVRASHRLATHALHTRLLLSTGLLAFAASLLGAPFFLTLPAAGTAYALARAGRRSIAAAIAVVLLGVFGGLFGAEWWAGDEAPEAAAEGPLSGVTTLGLLFSGLKAGLLTFGGAYTAIPFLEADATGPGGWMTHEQFLESIALVGVLPAPLIAFATFVGYLGGGPLGAVAMTFGIFLPAFLFTMIGYPIFDRLLANQRLHDVLDGVTAGVIGLILLTAIMLAPHAITSWVQAVVFGLALLLQYVWHSKAAVPVTVLGAALFGTASLFF